jgi:hypothetical protein
LAAWHLQTGLLAQQHVFPASGVGVPAAQAGVGVPIPSASTAIRTWTKVLKRATTFKQLQHREFISSPMMRSAGA